MCVCVCTDLYFHTHFTCHSHSQFPPVFLYNCTSVALAHDCSECVSLPPELGCGYCSSPAQCLHSTLCSAPDTFIGSQQDTGQCPVQFEVSRELTHSVSVLGVQVSSSGELLVRSSERVYVINTSGGGTVVSTLNGSSAVFQQSDILSSSAALRCEGNQCGLHPLTDLGQALWSSVDGPAPDGDWSGTQHHYTV